MFKIEQIEQTMTNLRAQAAQLQATADMLEAMIEPWKTLDASIKSNQILMEQWMNAWTKPQL